jgi:hypothetical protein
MREGAAFEWAGGIIVKAKRPHAVVALDHYTS